jgi:hypothetical protein
VSSPVFALILLPSNELDTCPLIYVVIGSDSLSYPSSSCHYGVVVFQHMYRQRHPLEIQSEEVWKASGCEMENGVRDEYEDIQEHPKFRVVRAAEA